MEPSGDAHADELDAVVDASAAGCGDSLALAFFAFALGSCSSCSVVCLLQLKLVSSGFVFVQNIVLLKESLGVLAHDCFQQQVIIDGPVIHANIWHGNLWHWDGKL